MIEVSTICGHPLLRGKIRGICHKCYGKFRHQIKKGLTTWEQLTEKREGGTTRHNKKIITVVKRIGQEGKSKECLISVLSKGEV